MDVDDEQGYGLWMARGERGIRGTGPFPTYSTYWYNTHEILDSLNLADATHKHTGTVRQ
jgi:hypothetical protein